MDYLATIRRGWEHVWNNKFLWVLGFLAALGSGTGASNSGYSFNGGDTGAMANWLTPERVAALTAGLIAFGCIAFIVGIILWLVSLSSYGGLIAGVTQLELGMAKPTFRSAFRLGWRHIWRLVGMSILLYIVPVILFIILLAAFLIPVIGASVAAGNADDPSALFAAIGGLGLIFFCLLCVLLLFVLALSLIYPFAFRGIILRNLGVMDSLRHGWRVVRENLGELILLLLAFLLLNIIIWIIALAILVPVGLAVGVPMVALMDADATFLQGLLAVLGVIIGLVVFALVSAILTAWQSSTFTLAYLQWTGKDVLTDVVGGVS
jgi:hypothetical protein